MNLYHSSPVKCLFLRRLSQRAHWNQEVKGPSRAKMMGEDLEDETKPQS